MKKLKIKKAIEENHKFLVSAAALTGIIEFSGIRALLASKLMRFHSNLSEVLTQEGALIILITVIGFNGLILYKTLNWSLDFLKGNEE